MTVPTTQAEIYRRCRVAMAACGKVLNAVETGIGKEPIFFESDLKVGGKVRRVECLEKLARELGVMADEEVRAGSWANERA